MLDYLFNTIIYWVLRISLRVASGAAVGAYVFWMALAMPDPVVGFHADLSNLPLIYYALPLFFALSVALFPGQVLSVFASAIDDKTSPMTPQQAKLESQTAP